MGPLLSIRGVPPRLWPSGHVCRGRFRGGQAGQPSTAQTPGSYSTGRTVVILIGGLASVYDDPHWQPVKVDLVSAGFVAGDIVPFSYSWAGGWYDPVLTCQDIGQSEALLASRIRVARSQGASGVVLVGHSLGGVLATDVVAQYPDLGIRGVVTVDSPMAGIPQIGIDVFNAVLGLHSDCLAAGQLAYRKQQGPAWITSLRSSVSSVLARGVRFASIVNDADGLYMTPGDQTVAGPAITFEDSWVDSGFNHAAVLTSPQGAALVAQLVGPPIQ